MQMEFFLNANKSAARSFLSGERRTYASCFIRAKPLFRAVDISHMKRYKIDLGDYTCMSNPDHTNKVLRTLSTYEDGPPSMPPGGPYWTEDQLALFAQWQKDGYQP